MENKKLVLHFVRHYVKCLGLDKWLSLPKKNRLEIVKSAIQHQLKVAPLAA